MDRVPNWDLDRATKFVEAVDSLNINWLEEPLEMHAYEDLAKLREVSEIKQKDKIAWTVAEKAKVKALDDHNWDLQWDYDDDWNEDDY